MNPVCFCGHPYFAHAPKTEGALAAWVCDECECLDFVEQEPDGTYNFADYDPLLAEMDKGKL